MDFDAIKKSLHIWYFVVIMIAYKQRVIDMDKQEQAQRFAEILLKTTHANHGHLSILELENISETAYSLADYMQAEADKRQNNTTVASHVESSEYYPHYEAGRDYPPDCYVMHNGKKTLAVSISNEWKPDWSQAPDDKITHWTMEKDKRYSWWIGEPKKDSQNHYESIENVNCSFYGDAPSFNYQGNWQDSLRKRPQGE